MLLLLFQKKSVLFSDWSLSYHAARLSACLPASTASPFSWGCTLALQLPWAPPALGEGRQRERDKGDSLQSDVWTWANHCTVLYFSLSCIACLAWKRSFAAHLCCVCLQQGLPVLLESSMLHLLKKGGCVWHASQHDRSCAETTCSVRLMLWNYPCA